MSAGSPDQMSRHVAAILAADVAGYSRLMEEAGGGAGIVGHGAAA